MADNPLIKLVIESFDIYFLIFARMLGIFLTAPFFSRREIPAVFKITLSVIISYMLLPFLASTVTISHNFLNVFMISIKEFAAGAAIGLTAQMLFNVFLAAGAQNDLQMGLSMAQQVDPSTGSQITNSGNLIVGFAYLIFLATDAHHIFLRGIINSYDILPIGAAVFKSSNFLNYIIKLMLYFAETSLLIVIPIVIILFLGNLLLAFLAKIMPQMNVFIVGMPFKILIGFVAMVIIFPHMKEVIKQVFESMIKYEYLLMRILGSSA